MSEEQERNLKPVFTAIIVFLLAVTGVMSYLWYSTSSALEETKTELDNAKKDMEAMNQMMAPMMGDGMTDDLMTDFKNMMSDYDKMRELGRPEDQEAMKAQQDKIQGLMTELETAKKNGTVTASLVAKLRRENETLRAIMRDYVRQIDELNTKNVQLSTDLDKTTAELSDTKVERDQFKDEAATSKAKVDVASKLKAYGFSSTGQRMKMNDTPEATTKARNAVQAVSSFTIAENDIAEAGPRTLYLQITDPSGKVLQGRSGGSDNGVVYSAKREVQYGNKALDVSIYYDFNGEEPIPGSYKVKIYCDGSVIGTDAFSLK
jgi:hypothetical protein